MEGKTVSERAESAMNSILSLREIAPGEQGQIFRLLPEGAMNRRLRDLGFAEGTVIKCLFHSMFGDPTAYEICGTVIALRACDGASVLVTALGEGGT